MPGERASSGIIENTIKTFKKLNSKNKIFAAVGPCIGNQSYEVDMDFYEDFLSKSKKNSIYFKNKYPKNYSILESMLMIN